MRLLLLMLALQSQPAVRATAADSVAARAGLTRALATFDSLGREAITQREAWRLLVQMNLWGMVDVGTRTAFRLDSTFSPAREINYWLVSQWAGERASVGDTVTVEAILESAPPAAREGILGSLASVLRFTRPELADRFEARLTRPTARAERLRRLALNARSRGDTAEAKRLFEEVVRLSRTDPNGGWEPMYSLYQLLEIGADVPLDDLLGTVDKATDDWWTGRTEVAKALLRSKRTELAKLVIDSLAAYVETQPPVRRAWIRSELHQVRGTTADSAIARAIMDSLAKAHAVDHPPPYENFDSRMVWDRDTTALKALLSRESVDSRVILQLVYTVRGYVTASTSAYGNTASMDLLRPFVRVVVDHVSPAIVRQPPIVRDSILSYHVATIAFLDIDRALDVARQIPTPRFRDRALAEVAVRLARTNADLAQRVVATVQDSIARGVVFGPLALAAVSGARLSLAEELAARATGEARVRAFYELAAKERDNALLADARRHSLLALAALNPVVRCNGCFIRVRTVPPPEPIPVTEGMNAQLIHNVVVLAVELGERDQVIRWASSRETPNARAIAHLAMVEGISRHRLGWRQSFPMH